jgi:hypothetical protein
MIFSCNVLTRCLLTWCTWYWDNVNQQVSLFRRFYWPLARYRYTQCLFYWSHFGQIW